MLTDDAGDLMLGAARIARFLNTLFENEGITSKDVYNWCARKVRPLPHTKSGSSIVGSKREIRAYLYPPAPVSQHSFVPARR